MLARTEHMIAHSIFSPVKKNNPIHEIALKYVKNFMNDFLLSVPSAIPDNIGDKIAIVKKLKAIPKEYRAVFIYLKPKKSTYSPSNTLSVGVL
jgi:hypothetical protein